MRALTFFLCCFFVMPSPAHAWNATGHKMTAEIAFNRLDAERQQRVVEVLRSHPRFAEDFASDMPVAIQPGSPEEALWIFQRASIWPDIVPGRGDLARDQFHRGTWHYINLPVFLTSEDRSDLRGKLEHNRSLQFDPPLARGMNVVQALQGNLQIWRDNAATDADKAVALCWILHLTGDLHQPLHTVALFSRGHFPSGDRGGNSIRVQQDHERTNLHAVWDDLPNDFADQLPALLAREIASPDGVIFAPEKWARKHSDLAMLNVYTPTLKDDLRRALAADENAAITLSVGYRANAGDLANGQILAAGQRIAAVLSH